MIETTPLNEKNVPEFGADFLTGLLTTSIYGFGISLLLGFGTHKIFLYLSAAAVMSLVLLSRGGFRIDRSTAVLLALVALLAAQTYLVASDARVGFRFLERLLWPVAAVVGVVMLPERFGSRWQLTHKSMLAVLAVVYVIAQWMGVAIYPDKFGLFSNPHFLALYCVLTLPILFHFSVVTSGELRWLFVLTSLADALLLLKTQSRPGFLALLVGSLAVVPFLAVRYRWMTVSAVVIIPGLLYVSGVYGFDARMDDLFGNLLKEERVAIWTETAEMQSASSALEWIFGHGFGRFYRDYQAYSSFHAMIDFSFPHNFLLELLYGHGVIGLVLVVAAYALFFGKLWGYTATVDHDARRQIGLLLIAVTMIHLVHAFLTLPFFSRSTLYPLSLILGAGFRFFKGAHG